MKTIKDMPEHSRPREKLREKGDLQPSENDRRTHEQLSKAAKNLGLRVLDHVIVTKKGHFSFQENGLIQ